MSREIAEKVCASGEFDPRSVRGAINDLLSDGGLTLGIDFKLRVSRGKFEERVLFLDIDGVLNGHEFNEASQSCGTRRECVQRLNRVIEGPVKIVISSAWRYMVLNGSMTEKGFENLLRTHGVACQGKVLGCTKPDEVISTREGQILAWVRTHRPLYWAVVDDMTLQLDNFVQTDKRSGLAEADVYRLREHLGVPAHLNEQTKAS